MWMISIAVCLIAAVAGLCASDWQALQSSRSCKMWQTWWRRDITGKEYKSTYRKQVDRTLREAASDAEYRRLEQLHRFGPCFRAQASHFENQEAMEKPSQKGMISERSQEPGDDH